jgi:hypothetical protein
VFAGRREGRPWLSTWIGVIAAAIALALALARAADTAESGLG